MWSPRIFTAFPDAEYYNIGDGTIGVLTNELWQQMIQNWDLLGALASNIVPSLNRESMTKFAPDVTTKRLVQATADHFSERAFFADFTTVKDSIQTNTLEQGGGEKRQWISQMREQISANDADTPNYASFLLGGCDHFGRF